MSTRMMGSANSERRRGRRRGRKRKRKWEREGRDMGRWFCETLEIRIPLRKHRFEKNIWVYPG